MENEELTQVLEEKLDCRREQGSPRRFDYVVAGTTVSRQFENYTVIPSDRPEALQAVGGMLSYLYETQKTELNHLRVLQYYTSGRFMELDLTARRNLELTETLRGKEKRGSLLWVLDRTRTAMGARLLRSWLEQPLLNPAAINRRLAAVRDLAEYTGGPGGADPCPEGDHRPGAAHRPGGLRHRRRTGSGGPGRRTAPDPALTGAAEPQALVPAPVGLPAAGPAGGADRPH